LPCALIAVKPTMSPAPSGSAPMMMSVVPDSRGVAAVVTVTGAPVGVAAGSQSPRPVGSPYRRNVRALDASAAAITRWWSSTALVRSRPSSLAPGALGIEPSSVAAESLPAPLTRV
jgi:hypothetical protein